eukprot:TRINITY_DN24940_c0_g1_i2.p4 TRINITY_DN24940_c0_g1~~TRINITY_DN24940_c0_g1_i2.p4  ORF type:complete len:124 (+),score=6.98 TRINITY_DN24940_c0_g1_i2:218-589(+)
MALAVHIQGRKMKLRYMLVYASSVFLLSMFMCESMAFSLWNLRPDLHVVIAHVWDSVMSSCSRDRFVIGVDSLNCRIWPGAVVSGGGRDGCCSEKAFDQELTRTAMLVLALLNIIVGPCICSL